MRTIQKIAAALSISGAANALSLARRATLGLTSYDFVAGQHNKVGTIDVDVTVASVKVTYKITMLGTHFTVSQVGVGCDKSLMTLTSPGEFKSYATDSSSKTAGAQVDNHPSGTTTYTYTFSLSGTGNTLAGCTGADDKFVVYAHADVKDVLFANGGRGAETGWGCSGWAQQGNRWACGCTKTGTDTTQVGKWPTWCIEDAPTPTPTGNSQVTILVVACSDTCNGQDMHCVNEECTCDSGYQWANGPMSTCEDIDECTEGTSGCDVETSLCVNKVGSVECIACPRGYQPNALGTECEDIQECDDADLNNCESRATCSNTVGSFTCTCVEGWTGAGTTDENEQCVDINECTNPLLNTCENDHAMCVNSDGSFACPCNAGWTGAGLKEDKCTDINECLSTSTAINACYGGLGNCNNNDGSYTCSCNTGFIGAGHFDDKCKASDFCSLYGQYNRAGKVTVSDSPYSDDSPLIKITIDTTALRMAIKESHVAIACTRAGIPQKNNTGTPIPGAFSKCDGTTCVGAQHSLPADTLVDTYPTLSVSNLKCAGGQVVVMVHYVLANGETTFGCGQCVAKGTSPLQATCNAAYTLTGTNRWAYYIPFVVGKI